MGKFLIIAGNSDIGLATARTLLARQHQVHLTVRSQSTISALSNEIDATFSLLDASDFEATLESFTTAERELGGPLDGVVNCCGSILLKPAHLTSQADYDEVIQTNLTTSFAVVRAAGKSMSKQGGSVVLISSAAARLGLPNHESIAAAKAGIIGLALSAAATYATRNLRFNVVAPGLVKTKLSQFLTNNPISCAASESQHPLGRLGEPGDIAAAIAFFLEPSNNWITGQVLAVDGGLSTLRTKSKA